MTQLNELFAKLNGPFSAIASAPRKYSLPNPNLANLAAGVVSNWPELDVIADLWVTGSTIWRLAYPNLQFPAVDVVFADLDMFATTKRAYDLMQIVFNAIKSEPPEGRSQPTRSRGVDGIGQRVFTTRGWVDIWHENRDVFSMLTSYPTDGYAHCRVAYCPSTRAVVMLANEASK